MKFCGRRNLFAKLILGASVALTSLLLSACHAGGGVTARPNSSTIYPVVSVPTIALPAMSPYISSSSSLVISGICQEGDTVVLSGDSVASQVCSNSTYSLTVIKNIDSIYSFLISQQDGHLNLSYPINLIWLRRSSIAAPTITYPPTPSFYSAQGTLALAGDCEANATLTLSGDATGTKNCVNSQFTFPINKGVDGDYTFQITQSDTAGNAASSTVHWHKHALVVNLSSSNPSPNPISLMVGYKQAFTVTGGSGIYTLAMAPNLSGGVLDATGYTYTVGSLANQTDVLQVTDSLGEIFNYGISSVPGLPDHFEIVAGNQQTRAIGKTLAVQPQIQLVDKFGNGVPNQAVFFQMTHGDAQIISNPIQTTDSNGYASVSARVGYSNIRNTLEVFPLTGVLPDAAGSGNATIQLSETASCLAANGTGSFGLSFPTVSIPGTVVLANFGLAHHDTNHRDIAVLNSGGANIGVLLNKGNGTYSNVNYSVCAGPTGIVTGDFDGDSIVDIAVSCASGFVGILIGKADGTFKGVVNRVTVAGPVGLAVADFNGDGYLDLAVASSSTSKVGIHFGKGDGTFNAAVYLTNTTNLNPIGIIAADMNVDGSPDLLVLNGGGTNTISLLLNTADKSGTFWPNSDQPTGQYPVMMVSGDFNSDGWPDIAVSDESVGNIDFYLNDGITGQLTAMQMVAAGNNPGPLAAADLKGSGFLKDLVVVNVVDNQVQVFQNQTGVGSSVVNFDTSILISYSLAPSAIVMGDTNGDLKVDIIGSVGAFGTSSSAINILQGQSSSIFGPAIAVQNNPTTAIVGRFFTGDTNLDLAVINQASKTVSILKGLGNGQFQSYPSINTGTSPIAGVVGDFNRDGNADLAILNSGSKSVSVFMGNGDGTFLARVDYPTGNSPSSIAMQDFDRNGVMDLVVVNQANNNVSILLGKTDGTFAAKVDYPVGQYPNTVAVSDFDRDGFMDLAVTNALDGTVSILLGNGDGTFQPQAAYNSETSTGSNPNVVVAADFDGDSIIDLAILNNGDGSLWILKGKGDGSFTAQSETQIDGSNMLSFVTGDFHGLGNLDIAVANGDNTFATIKGRGTGSFNNAVTWASANSGATFNGITVGDFNNDGILDLILVDSGTGVVETWMGQ
jgi:hypothetical protein